jgi:hypothetical protein
MIQQEQPDKIHPYMLMPDKPTIPLAPSKDDKDVATIPLAPQVEEAKHKLLMPDVDTLLLKSDVKEAKHKLLMPDVDMLLLKPETAEIVQKALSPDVLFTPLKSLVHQFVKTQSMPVAQTPAPKVHEVEARHRLLMPDTPTLLLKPVSDDKAAKTKPDLRQRVIRALNKRKTETINKRTTTAMPVLNVDTQVFGQVERGEAAVPVNPIHDAPASPFSAAYVQERLNRSICEAQVNKNYNEAIRLQLLSWKMEDKEISRIEVARKAWLRPASEKPVL